MIAGFFEEPGALDRVAGLAGDWFLRYVAPSGAVEATRLGAAKS